jgi:hypothetical protein
VEDGLLIAYPYQQQDGGLQVLQNAGDKSSLNNFISQIIIFKTI